MREKEDRLKMWKRTGEDDDRNEYKRAKGTAKKVVARVKAETIEELYAKLETSEGQKDIYRIAAARDRAGKDIGQMRTIKSATGDVLMRDEDIRERWGQYFSWLMNEENPRVETEEREPNQGLTAPINEAETARALKGMQSGKAVGSDKIPAEVWKCLGLFGVVTLCKLFNSIMITETIPSAWRDSVLVPIFKEKGDIQEGKNYRGIKLLTHTFKIWERVLDRQVRECMDIHESQFGFMPGRSTTDAIFIIKQTIEQCREGQKDICVTFIDLEKAYDRVPREEIWRSMRERLVPEKYVKLVQYMYTGIDWMPNEGTHSRGRKQQIQCCGWPTPGICIKPVPLPHTDGRADGKGDEGSPRVDAVCRRHRVVRRQGCGHDRVPGVVEESLGREGNVGQ